MMCIFISSSMKCVPSQLLIKISNIPLSFCSIICSVSLFHISFYLFSSSLNCFTVFYVFKGSLFYFIDFVLFIVAILVVWFLFFIICFILLILSLSVFLRYMFIWYLSASEKGLIPLTFPHVVLLLFFVDSTMLCFHIVHKTNLTHPFIFSPSLVAQDSVVWFMKAK